MMIVVAAIYKFVDLPDYKEVHSQLNNLSLEHGLKGTLLVAKEGINGTVSGSREGIDSLKQYFDNDERFLGMQYKESFYSENPFYRMKVKIKKEIVTLGHPQADPKKMVGEYVDAQQFNELINDPEVKVIDVRNEYETAIGTFKNAIDPKTKSFREFPQFVKNNLDPKKHKKIAMFCTGGIRCEKASSYMKQEGFGEVYHLKGGILDYLKYTKKEESFFLGDCFVFDNRVSVNHELDKGEYSACHGCRHPISEADMASKYYEHGVSCPNCYAQRSETQKARAKERQRQVEIMSQRGQEHIGAQQKK